MIKNNTSLRIMFLGTGSDAGKSIIATGFCRILYRMGYKTAPFKAQNMALNSFVTMDGKEMGRAQVTQAYAANIQPDCDMNPILLKPSGNNTTQVIVHGKVFRNLSAKNYYNMKNDLFPEVMESYTNLSKKYNAIVLEGAGSASEINLKDNDIVNIYMAKKIHSPVIIVADIDRGGVFASIIGTMKLFSRKERKLVIGFIINKFRGDKRLFYDGVNFIERKTKRPVFGIIPYFNDICIPEEDSVQLQLGNKGKKSSNALVKIAVIHLPYISNYTDFDPFEIEKGVSLSYIRSPEMIDDSTVVIIPGTKNTIEDLLWLKEKGFKNALKTHIDKGKTLVGICGGYQMLGRWIEDPYHIESNTNKVKGLGFIEISTVLNKQKTLSRVKGVSLIKDLKNHDKSIQVEGYEIHMGKTKMIHGINPSFKIIKDSSFSNEYYDGAVLENGKVWGTYLHGLFENDDFRYRFLEINGRNRSKKINYKKYLDDQYNKLADLIEKNVDVNRILDIAKSSSF